MVTRTHLSSHARALCLSLLLVWGLAGCEKSPLAEPEMLALHPSSTDASGGNWKHILISGHAVAAVEAPAATNSASYQAELAELKQAMNGRTGAQATAVKYWSAGATIRWNEIARSLVAKYNVAPDVGTPFDPTTPIASPPFSSRVYALLSVAQYDALVTAWHYKHQFNRLAPAKADPSLQPLVPATDLPAYPSEDAVVAAASFEVLAFLFPKEREYLQRLMQQHQEARLWAGANVRSDLTAGAALGQAVAAKVVDYAKTDKMGLARDPDDTWKQIVVPEKWVSLEVPARPPLLPLMKDVKSWFDVEALRATLPGPPPEVGSPAFQTALQEVRQYADKRTREQWRIADFWADGAGTHTPPGHWNQIATDLIRREQLSELRAARTYALLNRAMMDAAICCWLTKFEYYYPRPSQMDPKIKTSTGVPNFPAYTSGHATFSASAATVLAYVFPSEGASLQAMAEEAAMSRLYGGIHYRFDNEAGLKCGQGIGQVGIRWAKGDRSPQ